MRVTLVASEGPSLVRVSVYDTMPPLTALIGPLFERSRSALGTRVSVSLAVSLPGKRSLGWETLAVFTNVPVAAEEIVPVAV